MKFYMPKFDANILQKKILHWCVHYSDGL